MDISEFDPSSWKDLTFYLAYYKKPEHRWVIVANYKPPGWTRQWLVFDPHKGGGNIGLSLYTTEEMRFLFESDRDEKGKQKRASWKEINKCLSRLPYNLLPKWRPRVRPPWYEN